MAIIANEGTVSHVRDSWLAPSVPTGPKCPHQVSPSVPSVGPAPSVGPVVIIKGGHRAIRFVGQPFNTTGGAICCRVIPACVRAIGDIAFIIDAVVVDIMAARTSDRHVATAAAFAADIPGADAPLGSRIDKAGLAVLILNAFIENLS